MICSEQRENATYISKLDWNRRVAARIRRFSPPIDEILVKFAVSRCGSQLIMSIEDLLMTTRWFPFLPRLARLAGFHFFHNLHDSLVSIFFRNLQLAGFHLFHNLPGSRSSRSSSSSSRVLVIGTGLGSCMIVPSRPARPVFVIDLVQQHFYDVSMDYAGSESRSPIFPGTIRHFT